MKQVIFGLTSLIVSIGTVWADYDWTHFGGSYYALTQDYSSWQEAEDEAVSLGGHLVAINSSQENEWLADFIIGARARNYGEADHNIAWIGYINTGGGNWEWVSGDPVTFTSYYSQWPQGGTKAYLHGAAHFSPGTWNANYVHDAIYGHQPKGIIELPSPPPTVSLSLQVEPNDIGIDTVIPLLGEHQYTQDMTVSISAEPFAVCPDVYQFDHWEGNVADVNSANTTIVMDANQIVIAVFVDERQCGDECHPYTLGDMNMDCITNFKDFAILAQGWLECTKPECD